MLCLRESSPGWDDLQAKVFKHCIFDLSSVLTHIMNLCIQQCIFPSELKIAKIIPVFKAGEKESLNNYRPIAVLPCISKIFEKLIHKRMMDFIQKHDLLYENQYGFRPNHSTSSAIAHVINNITTANEQGKYTIGLFLDLSKAFDCLDFDILFEKLSTYGFRGTTLQLLKSYLSRREQFVVVNDFQSAHLLSRRDVPQGSILGPLLFLLYINDIHTSSDILSFTLYADDTNILLNGTNLDIIHTMTAELPHIIDWLNANKLSLNVKKTHYVIFRPGRLPLKSNRPLLMNGQPVTQETTTKFLGIILDSRLTFAQHIHYIRNKSSKNIGILSKLRKVLPTSTLVQLYNALILPYLQYCLEIWGSAPDTHINSLLKLQKQCCRIVTSSPPATPSQPLFDRLKVMPISTLFRYALGLFVFKLRSGLVPPPISALFRYLHPPTSTHASRQMNILKLPQYHFSSSQLTLSFTCCRCAVSLIHNALSY